MDPTFVPSAFPPLALGFFGLGTGYLIYGPYELLKWPPRENGVAESLGTWGIWLPGFCQFVCGTMLFAGLTFFRVFGLSPDGRPLTATPDYMAALAFSAYGIHWFAMGWNRAHGHDPRPNAGMSVAFMVISALGAVVFFHASDWPVGLLFVLLFLIYLSDFFHAVGVAIAENAHGLFHCVTGVWLMYLTFAVGVNFSLGFHWTV